MQPAIADEDLEETRAVLEQKLSDSRELVDLLTIKMNALWQQFYNMDDMGTRDKIQLEISETYNRLLKAQETQAQAEESLNAIASRPRD